MWYVDPHMPLPVDIGSPHLEDADFYIFEDFKYPKAYCFDTRIKAIEKIIEIEKILLFARSIWCPLYYHSLPIEIGVFWDESFNLVNNNTRKRVTNKTIFNTELEAIDYAINHPDPIFLIRKKELLLKSG